MYYPLTHEDQCPQCGGLPAGNELIGQPMRMFPGTRWEVCRCVSTGIIGHAPGRYIKPHRY